MKTIGLWSVGLALALTSAGATASDEMGFVTLFNGKNLSGWVNVNCAPDTFTVREGMIHSTGVPTGVMRTEKQYENFILELEWRHMQEGGNAGLFVWSDPLTAPGVPFARSIEVQILDGRNSELYTSHGDVFAIHGATMKGDRLTVELNGRKVIDDAQLPGVPTRGPIGLQHHGHPIQFANLYVKTLN